MASDANVESGVVRADTRSQTPRLRAAASISSEGRCVATNAEAEGSGEAVTYSTAVCRIAYISVWLRLRSR